VRVTVFGATGRTGRHLLTEGLRRGHQLTAFTRRPGALADPAVLADVVVGDARDPEAVGKAVGGADAVISTISAERRTGPYPVAEATAVIAGAMADLGVRRLVVTSAYGMVAERPRLLAPLLRRWLAAPFADAAAMERAVAASGLDWTVVRLPLLTDRPARGRFRTSGELFTGGPYPLARADAAAALLDIAEAAIFARTAVNVAAA
jgi:putative NADH-flavin reductase